VYLSACETDADLFQVMVLNQRLKEATEMAQVINSREKLFDFPQTSFEEIESMITTFKPYADLWSIASEFQKVCVVTYTHTYIYDYDL
jgi:hypothetical protein